MRTRSASVLIFLALMLCLITAQPSYFKAHASSGYPVHDLNTGLNYTTIGEAIAANETLTGDTIFVEKGVYNESLNVVKQLHLVGEDRETTIIDGGIANEVVGLLPGASITNFTIRHGFYGIQAYSWPIVPQYGGNSIINNNVEDAAYAGIVLGKVYNNTIMDNIITGNILSGIHVWSSTNNTITNNTVFNNGHGIDFYGDCRDNVLRNNTMSNNTYNFGLIWYGETMNWLLDTSGRPSIINDIDASNTVNGKPIYCWVNKSDENVPLDAGFVWLIDCDNITVKNLNLSNNIEGIMLAGTTNTQIESNNITRNAYGIHVSLFSHNNTLVNNTLEDNSNGVYLAEFASNTTMRNNAISGGQYNFGVPSYVPGVLVFQTPYINGTSGLDDIDLSNTVDGKPIVWWVDQHNMKVPSNAGYVTLINCTDITVEGLSLSNNVQNIILVNSNSTLISNNSISNSVNGISIVDLYVFAGSSWLAQPSVNNTIVGNTIHDNGVGCRLEKGDATILNNTLLRNPIGIELKSINNSTIAGNTVIGSDLNITYISSLPRDAIIFFHPLQYWQLDSDLNNLNVGGIMFDGKSNMIYDNTVEDSYAGLIVGYLGYSQNNVVCHNNLINNTIQAWEPSPSNYWDFGYPTGGNYWSDYTGIDAKSGPNQDQPGSDGVGDTPFLLNKLIDHYPLMSPYTNLYDIAIAYPMMTRAFFSQHREIINISIGVVNLSVETETFNVTFQANSTTIATLQNVSLAVGKSTDINYEWNVTGLPYGEYLINASATPVPNETRTADNTRSLLTVHTIPGDLNQDGTVGSDDARILGDAFLATPGSSNWNPNADINGDGEVNILDAIILGSNFGRAW
jgi:parallel beta-helix repeat protein